MSSEAIQISPAAISALERGKKGEAIKIIRKETNAGLKESSDAVDLFLTANQLVHDKWKAHTKWYDGMVAISVFAVIAVVLSSLLVTGIMSVLGKVLS